MSKPKIIISAIVGLAVVGGGAYLGFRFLDLGSLTAQELTAEIPASRPKRLDAAQLERFSGQSMKQILETLKAEIQPAEASPPPGTDETLLASLPDAPYPFPEDAVAANGAALKEFVTNLQRSATEAPTDEDKRLFRLALAGLHVPPSQIPESLRSGDPPAPESETFSVKLQNRTTGFSAPFAFGNFDGDPEMEVIADGGNRILQVEGDTVKEDKLQIEITVPGNGLYPADFDSDGDLDLLLTRGNGYPDSLYRNEGNGKFQDVTAETGLLTFADTTAAAWLDYDGDGFLDLLVGSSDHPLELFHQTGPGTFQPLAWDLKLWIHKGTGTISVADISGDGLPDFYVGLSGQPDRLYITKSAGAWEQWRFEDIAAANGMSGTNDAGKVHFTDFDGDGDSDMLQCESGKGLRLLQNAGGQKFTDVTEDAGLPADLAATAAGSFDIDNDGYLEILAGTSPLELNRLYWNLGGAGFREISVVSAASYLDSPTEIVSVDLDADGEIDLLYPEGGGAVRRLEPAGTSGKWIRVHVSGHLPGTKVAVTVRDADWVMRTVESRLAMQAAETIGLGDATTIEKIAVFLPGEKEPAAIAEEANPNESVSIVLPKRPRKRAVVPISDENAEASSAQ